MTERELKKLSRADLLELLLNERRENEGLRLQLEQAGSIAEAALQLNGVFAAAEAAAEQYLDSVRRLTEEQRNE